MIIYGIPTLNHQQYILEKHLPSIVNNTIKPDMVMIYDNSEKYVWFGEVNDHLVEDPLYGGIILDISYARNDAESNNSLAHAWNSIMRFAASRDEPTTVILANDDIVLMPNTIELLVNAPYEFAYPAGALSGNSFSLFKIDVAMWKDVGEFDTMFVPAYFEDNDFHKRMLLKGYDIHPVIQAEYHHEGSGTLKALTPEEQLKRQQLFRRCQTYFLLKWGCLHGQCNYSDMYDEPFNGADSDEMKRLFNENYRLF